MIAKWMAAGTLAVAAAAAQGQPYPAKPIKVVVPYGPGTGVDVAARLLTTPLAAALGQAIVVENRPGAAGSVGTAYVANAPADGYTLLVHASSITSVPAYTPNVPYKMSELRGVSIYADMTYVLVASAGSGIRTIRELVDTARARPGALTFASAGVGTGTYIGAEKLHIATGMKVRHIPYKSTTDALADVIAGRVDYGYTQITSAIGHINAGKLNALAISSVPSSVLPNVPPVSSIAPEAYYSLWMGLFAPAGTPDAIVRRLYQAVEKVRETQTFRQALAKVGGEPMRHGPVETDDILGKEIKENADMVSRLGISPQ
ncbi:tripartite tricarboxylate transporter substrate binding protein [Pigmentiphaga soli]|uniref:Tripartite tricarboxylate transporter substrate binding protein n=1 Tax=Pigmentiphaga soli TaxID=1007095 RepID=A0ABP8HFJ1_9BURK